MQFDIVGPRIEIFEIRRMEPFGQLLNRHEVIGRIVKLVEHHMIIPSFYSL